MKYFLFFSRSLLPQRCTNCKLTAAVLLNYVYEESDMGMMVWVFRRIGYVQVWKWWVWHHWRKCNCIFLHRAWIFGEDRTEPTVSSFHWCKISSEMRDLFGTTFMLMVQKTHVETFSWRESHGLPQATNILWEKRREKKCCAVGIALHSKCFLVKLFIFSSSAPGSR